MLSNILPLALVGGAGYYFYSQWAADNPDAASGTIETRLSGFFSGIVNTVQGAFSNLTGGAGSPTNGEPSMDSTSGISGLISSLENGVTGN